MTHRFSWPTALAATGIAVSLLVTGPAMAEKPSGPGKGHPGKMHHKMMSKIDVDGDKRISRDEFTNFHARKFDKMDSNGDHFIDADERKAHHEQMKKRHKAAVERRQQEGDEGKE